MGTIQLTRARLHAARLDEEIAAGVDPATSAELDDCGVHPRGVALTRLLLADSTGPMYRPADSRELQLAVRRARSAL